ncbi:hypothetical protein [Paracidovorax konjaci]|uniref:Uncharacterized protein n=1 Tax=Paracidovorax konjaci TaxID=32040 RepID=A0A1I1Y0J2_9BURK|nr:hypothetical protein [Paracidovorax konjaci]SFE12929.1 hypothetical protein SAMN04489710_11548 [Paracidovorax konjaci]
MKCWKTVGVLSCPAELHSPASLTVKEVAQKLSRAFRLLSGVSSQKSLQQFCKWTVVSGLLGGSAFTAQAFDLSPKGTRFDRDAVKAWAPSRLDGILSSLAERGLPKFKQSVHEEITHRAHDCNYEGIGICSNPDAEYATPYVIAGVRWNDDPPFQMKSQQVQGTSCKTTYPDGRPVTIRFITQPRCWGELFLAAEKQIKASPEKTFDAASQAALPLRSHFGDLQFIHSMASANDEDPIETRRKILGWAEFTWGVAMGDYELGTWLKDVKLPVIEQFFGTSGWRVQDLFALGDPSLRSHLDDVAFGSLLHMVEDSFAAGHVDRMEPAAGKKCAGSLHRAPGPIQEFHSYTHQDSSRHAEADSRTAFVNNRLVPDVVDVGRALVALRQAKAGWPEVSAYLECVYDLTPAVRKATAGNF